MSFSQNQVDFHTGGDTINYFCSIASVSESAVNSLAGHMHMHGQIREIVGIVYATSSAVTYFSEYPINDTYHDLATNVL